MKLRKYIIIGAAIAYFINGLSFSLKEYWPNRTKIQDQGFSWIQEYKDFQKAQEFSLQLQHK